MLDYNDKENYQYTKTNYENCCTLLSVGTRGKLTTDYQHGAAICQLPVDR